MEKIRKIKKISLLDLKYTISDLPHAIELKMLHHKVRKDENSVYGAIRICCDFFKEEERLVKNMIYNYLNSKNSVDEYGKISQGILTFDDLQIYLYMLFKVDSRVAKEIAEKYEYIHVDEYQDTSTLQSFLIKELQSIHGNLFIVGDPYQAIYQWRDISIEYKEFYNPFEETDEVIRQVKKISEFDHNYRRFCIMYRNQEMSTIIERQLFEQNIPYRKLNGSNTSINERIEAKEMLSFMSLLLNPESAKNYERIANKPAKAITKKVLETVQEEADNMLIPYTQAVYDLAEKENAKGYSNLAELVSLVQMYHGLLKDSPNESISELVFALAKDTGYLDDNLETQMENLSEDKHTMFLKSLENFLFLKDDEKILTSYFLSLLQNFENSGENISYTAFEKLEMFIEKQQLGDTDGQDSKARQTADNKITFTTIHPAKGLEFEYIYLIGMEQGVFPDNDSVDDAFNGDQTSMEEERNVMYVALTRAMKKITLCHSKNRTIYGKKALYDPSQFIKELRL